MKRENIIASYRSVTSPIKKKATNDYYLLILKFLMGKREFKYTLNKSHLKAIFALCLFIFSAHSLAAQNRWWVAIDDGTDKYWDDNANWSKTQYGNGGASAPTSKNLIAIFTNASTVDAKLRTNINKINKLKLLNGYSGNINLNGYHLASSQGPMINDGNVLVTAGSFFQTWGWLYINSGGAVTASGDGSRIKLGHNLSINGGTLTAPSGGSNRFILRGGFNLYGGGVFNHNNGTVTMSTRWRGTPGAAIRIDAGPGTGRNFYNLYKSGNKHATLSTNDIEVENDLTIIGVGSIRAQSNNISVGGDWTLNSWKNFDAGTGKVIFNGSSAQTISWLTNNTRKFRHLQISNSDVSLAKNTGISGTLTIDSGATLDINGKNLTASTLVNNGNLQLSGSETVSISTKDTDSGTITYDGTATGLAYGNTYFNLALNSTGTMTLDADLDVNGSLMISDGTLNTGNNDINVAGNWTNSDSFISGTGKVTFDGTSNIVTGGTGDSNDFYDVTLGGTSAAQSTNAIAIDNNFEITSSGTWYTNCLAMTVSGNTTTGSGSIATTLSPTVAFSPANSATGVLVGSNLTLTFNTAIRNTNDSALTDSNVDSLITLKTTNSSGSDIAFDATIDSDKKIITINPDSDFSSEQVIYIAIGTTVEDDANNAISASSGTFTAREIGVSDTTAPTITFSPADLATSIAKDSNITLTFSEAIRNTDNSEITNSNVGSLVTLKATNSSGNDIAFNASIDSAKSVITINPSSDFSSEQVIYIAIGATVEDLYDNVITASSISFTAIDSISPTLAFDPIDLENPVPVTDNITITFNEAIRNTDDSTLTSTNVDSLISLKDTDENGTDIDFNATIDSNKKIITINPDSSLSSEQTVYVAIGATLEDDSNNAITASSITFVAADSTAPNLDFTPADSATGIAVNSDITIAFDEVIRNTNDSALTDSNVDTLITLKTTNSSGSDITFDAVIDNSKQLITIAPSSDFSSEQVIYVAIGATVEDASDNAISASSITFTAADSTAPTVAFVPPDASNCVPISSNVSLTFNEAVRNPDDSAITDSNVGNLITLEYTSDSSPVAFTATIDSDKKIITINPDSDFVSGEVVNVAIESVEDSSNNTMSATSGTFCVVDSTAPVLTFSPANSSTMVAEDADITLTFNEEIRLINDSALNNTNVDGLITLKETDANGNDIAFDATIDSDNKVITVDLVSDLSSNQIVYVAIGATVEDSYNNAITADSATFTTGDSLPPTVEIEAVITASIATDSDITFTFSEKIRLVNDNEADNTNVGSLITLKDTGANGADIPFSATINAAKTIITINPTSNFSSQQIVYAEVPGNTFEDYSDNLVPQTIKTFTAEYLKTSLSNPLNEKDVIGLIEAQIESAKRMIVHSTKPVLRRMEFLRRHNDQNNLSNQGVKLRFVNSSVTEMSHALNLSSLVNQTSDLFGNDWAIWSEGSVTIGETDENTFSSIKKIKSNGITLGIDKIVDTNQIYGVAIRMEDDESDIGSSGSKLDTDSLSLSLYGTFPFSEKTYIDGTFGVGKLSTDLTRIHESGTLTGKRKGEQIFSSVLYGAEFNNDITLSPYGRIDAGYTKLKSYSDSGKVASINYNEQKIKTARASIGLLIDDEIQTQKATFMPNARIEYGKDIVNASDAVLSYVVYPNTDYTFRIDREETDNFRIGFGTDVLVDGGWILSADFERNQEENSSYENSINLGASFQPNQNTEYSVSIIGGDSSSKQFGLNYDKSLTDDWTLNAGLEVAKSSNSGYNNTVEFNTRMSF